LNLFVVFLRRLALAASLLCLVGLGGVAMLRSLGWREFANPPRLGADATAIIERLGDPGFDRRTAGDTDDDYQLGYTDGLGTRHHLRVHDGVITQIGHSSR
jgi:hypothetical protein